MLLSILFQFYIARAISARLPRTDLDVSWGVGSRFLDQVKILQGLGKFGVEVRNGAQENQRIN